MILKRKVIIAILTAALLFLAAVGVLVWNGMTDHLGVADVALVLGNTVNPDGTPSDRLKARLDKTVELYQTGYFQKIIASGGTGAEGVPEGTAMKRYLVSAGIPESSVIVDDKGVNTQASAAFTAAFMRSEKLGSVFVITQYFHIPRSKLALRKEGVSPVFNAQPRFFEARDIYSTVRELPAYLKYLIQTSKSHQDGAVTAG
jgi:uncharacterized SAM-binding protein YcdF (DUF218 family)